MAPLCSDVTLLSNLVFFAPFKQLGYESFHGPVISLRCSADRLIAVHADLTVGYYRWHSFPDGEGTPFTLRMERQRRLPSAALSASVGALADKGDFKRNRASTSASLGSRGSDGSWSGSNKSSWGRGESDSSIAPRLGLGLGLGFGLGLVRESDSSIAPGSGGSSERSDGAGVQAGVRSLMSFTSTLFSRIGGAGGGQGGPGKASGLDGPDGPPGNAPLDTAPNPDLTPNPHPNSTANPFSDPPLLSNLSEPVLSATAPDDGVSFLEVRARHVAIGMGDSGLSAIGGIGAGGGRVISCGYWNHTLKVM